MTQQYSVVFKDGTSLENAILYHKDQNCVIYLRDTASARESGGKRYDLVWTSPDQIAKIKETLIGPFEDPSFSKLPAEKMKRKAQKAREARQVQLLRLSGQIDEFAMRLFMALAKTVPCKWYFEETAIREPRAEPMAIVVLDELVINPPYRPEDFLPTPQASSGTVEWIGKMVSRERGKLESALLRQ